MEGLAWDIPEMSPPEYAMVQAEPDASIWKKLNEEQPLPDMLPDMDIVSPIPQGPPPQLGVIEAEAKLQQLQSVSSLPSWQSALPSQSLS
jgi:hypothetical protein